MEQTIILLGASVLALVFGAMLGYFVRQFLAKRRAGSIEQKLQQRIEQAEKDAEGIILKAEQKAKDGLNAAKVEEDERRKNLVKTEQLVLKRESTLDRRNSEFEEKEQEFRRKVEKLKQIEKNLENSEEEIAKKLEDVAGLPREKAKEELIAQVERKYEQDIVGRIRKLEAEGQERFDRRAKEIVASAIQKTAVSQTQEITTTTVVLPSEDMKGKIIEKKEEISARWSVWPGWKSWWMRRPKPWSSPGLILCAGISRKSL